MWPVAVQFPVDFELPLQFHCTPYRTGQRNGNALDLHSADAKFGPGTGTKSIPGSEFAVVLVGPSSQIPE
jgi:hypothetical protein